jgi:transcriptional regulator with XRE-family HTH domain
MDAFATKLRQRARELKISNSEAARRAGLSERRYAHYVGGTREPDLATLVRIAEALGTTPSMLLGFGAGKRDRAQRSALKTRLNAAVNAMSDRELEILVVQAEAVASHVGSASVR